jgi:hypothetical protein
VRTAFLLEVFGEYSKIRVTVGHHLPAPLGCGDLYMEKLKKDAFFERNKPLGCGNLYMEKPRKRCISQKKNKPLYRGDMYMRNRENIPQKQTTVPWRYVHGNIVNTPFLSSISHTIYTHQCQVVAVFYFERRLARHVTHNFSEFHI